MASGIFTRFIVTQAGIITCWRSTNRSRIASRPQQRFPTTRQRRVHGFGSALIPDHYRRQDPRPVSCYALFKWWLLLSQHPGCRSILTSFRTKRGFGTLTGGLDFSPFDLGYCHSKSFSRGYTTGIRSLVRHSELVAPVVDPVALPPMADPRGYP